MMKKISLILVFLFAYTSTIIAQTLENSLLWKISGNGLTETSYLFGTIHVTCDASLNSKIKDALKATSQIVLEIDIDDPMLQAKMMKGMAMKDGKSIKDLVSKEDFNAIDSLFIKNMGMSVTMMQNAKPMLLSSMLLPKLLDCSMQSFEMELVKAAKSEQEEVKGLETIAYQLAVFDRIPYKDQVKELVRSAKDNMSFDRAVIKNLLKVYQSEDITQMLEMMNQDEAGVVRNYREILLDERNQNWIPEIEKFAKEKATFFGVGAAHLAGEKGVIKLLRKKGFTVEPVL